MVVYTQKLNMHETLELHELLTLKTACAAKAASMENSASDPQLKGLFRQDFENSKRQIQELQDLLSKNMSS